MKLHELSTTDLLYNAVLDMHVKVINTYSGKAWYKMRYHGDYDSSISNIDEESIGLWEREEIKNETR